MITRLLHTRYRVNDLDKTASFYKDVLGLKEVSRHTNRSRGSTLAFFETPGSKEQIEICHYPGQRPGAGPARPHPPGLRSRRPGRLREDAAAAKGYPLSDGPTVTDSGNKIAFIDGPEGYEFELIEKKK